MESPQKEDIFTPKIIAFYLQVVMRVMKYDYICLYNE